MAEAEINAITLRLFTEKLTEMVFAARTLGASVGTLDTALRQALDATGSVGRERRLVRPGLPVGRRALCLTGEIPPTWP